MVMTSIQMPGGGEVQLPHLEAHENSDARKEVERVSSEKAALFCRSHVTIERVHQELSAYSLGPHDSASDAGFATTTLKPLQSFI